MSLATPLPSQDAAFSAALTKLSEPGCRGIVIQGPSGAGKTWLARLIAHHLAKSMEDPVIEATGQRDAGRSKLNPWLLARHGHGDNILRRERAVDVAADALRVPIASKLTWGLSDIFSVLLKARHKFHSGPRTLTDDQYNIIYWITKIVHNRSWILIADDLQWWDDDSIELLRSVFSKRFVESFPFFSRVRVIAVVTASGEPLNESIHRFIRDNHLYTIDLEGPDRNSTARALEIFGVNEVNHELIDFVCATTGGHLQLIREVGNYIARTSLVNRRSLLSGSGCPGDLRWIRDLFDARLDKAQVDNEAFVQFLESAATIGVLFSEDQLRCLVGFKDDAFVKLLGSAADQSILSREGTVIRFRHAILQQILCSPSLARNQALHEQFVQCLQRLNPGDYVTRALHCKLSGDSHQSDVLLILDATKRIRDGLIPWNTTSVITCPLDDNSPLVKVADCLLRASDCSVRQKYTEAYRILESLSYEIPLLLGAERAYLLADCRLKSIEVSDRQFSIDLLRDWRPRVEHDFEMWVRVSLTLMAALALNEDIGAAVEIEREICAAIDRREKYDPDSNLYRGELYRRSDAIYDPEIAIRRLTDAVIIFRGVQDAPRRPTAFLRAATNLVGTQVVLGEYAAASEIAAEITNLLTLFPNLILPRPTTALNNITLIQALQEAVDHVAIIDAFAKILSECNRPEDSMLIRSNYVACLARAGRLEEATKQATQCAHELNCLYHADAYYQYIIGSNLFAIDLVSGSIADPVRRWNSLRPTIESLSPHVRVFLERRHQLLKQALTEKIEWDIEEWDNFLRLRYPRIIGRAWTFYGRGFLFSDLQHWSDG